ncbi:type VII secretion protein EccCb [Mycolicibacterium sp. 018/SC-01/001]|uniref:type VII secretion protein EccCb n=1 Tax=Mycolicibacterium sp. 018/SC-01/001 TaxID=2592069 RepID=UPI00117ED76C|nr:type VII secretion protein EccCb [Mycolicibacterium sp. 018/SC-01/001]TRW81679.1 type VII secretion protein EccCb [Mycolicibacterium sp. 018/SC-01/001]
MEPECRPGGRIALDAPPPVPEATPVHPLARLMPVAMVVAVVGMGALYLRSGVASARSPMFLVLPAMMVVSLIGMLAHGGRGGLRTAEIDAQRADYLRYLDATDAVLQAGAAAQHRWLHRHHPEPAALWPLAGTPQMWQRGDDHSEFLCVRVGIGVVDSATSVALPELGSDDSTDPVTTTAVRRLADDRSSLPDVPVLVSLVRTRVITVAGEPGDCRAVVRALLCQLVVAHAPSQVGVSIDAVRGDAWDWLKWVPHIRSRGGARHRVVIAEGALPPPAPGVTVVQIRAAESPVVVSADGAEVVARYDTLSLPEAVTCARRVSRSSPRGGPSRPTGWPALMGIADPGTFEPLSRWSQPARSPLRVPIGVAEDGSVVELDIKEAAAGGMGPHGLCIGATGSGKSEFLRTLVLGMITAHPPEELNLVLVDFKGGATFLGLDVVNHVSAVITNLADEAPLVARMRDALSGEITRRQEVLRAAGNLADLAAYRRARTRDPGLAPLPSLFVVIDEFSELLSQQPDFADLFVAIGRLGRSLGVHLLLASQRLDEGRLRGLDAHLAYRVCLKTFSTADSRAVLGVPDAHHLPAQPGAAFIKTATGQMIRFQTAFVSGRVPVPAPAANAGGVAVEQFHRTTDASPPSDTRPLLATMLARLRGLGGRAHRVWLPPLRRSPILADLLDGVAPSRLRVPIGVIDRPAQQRYEPLIVDMSGAAGNAAIVGAPQSGKSTALRTLVTALAARHDAATAQFYCLDFGGGALNALRDVPHVGCVAARHEADLCRRTVAHLEAVLRSREETPRRDTDPDVFLVIDGWSTLRSEFDALESVVTGLAARGLSHGVHVVLTASRWADLRPALKDQIGTRIELRLGEPAESEMDRRRARELGSAPAGRGLTRDGHEIAIALPGAAAIRTTATAPRAPRVELLPTTVAHDTISAAPRHHGQVLVGLGEHDLTAVALDFTDHPHLLILGDSESGKTALLRTLCSDLMRSHTPQEISLEIVDYRRTLLGVVETAHLAGYSASPVALEGRLRALLARLTARMPDEHVTQRQLRTRSWWTGPEIYVIVDDYDLVAGATGNPLTPLADFLPHARDLGLHVVVARRSGGAARAMFDPVLTRLREMGCSGFLMSASPEEGAPLGSTRAAPLPPGRGVLSRRGRSDELVQVGWLDPP